MSKPPRIAFIVDALPSLGGGEKTLFAALEEFPQADIFTLIYNRDAFTDTPIAAKTVVTSYLDRLPWARRHHRLLLPLMPAAIESFDLCRYDSIVSFSYAVAHGVLTTPGTRHLSYTYTPMRYAWSDLNLDGTHSRKNPLVNILIENFRTWDKTAASRVEEYAAISHGIARRIQSSYQREARVIYPPVEVDRFHANGTRGDYFVTLSRLVPHKRLDVVVEAFSRLGLSLKVIGEGPEKERLQKRAAPNVEFLGFQSDQRVAEILMRARGFVCAAEEDFGIAMVEAQAAGCPVIAYQAGGALETVIEGTTGLFFEKQSAGSLIEVIQQFRDATHCFQPRDLIENAQRFSKERFRKSFREFVG